MKAENDNYYSFCNSKDIYDSGSERSKSELFLECLACCNCCYKTGSGC